MEFIKTSEPLSNFVCYVSRLFVVLVFRPRYILSLERLQCNGVRL